MNLPFPTDLSGKVAIVTGGSGVLGGVLSEALALAGAKVVVLARTQEKIDQVVNRIHENGGEAYGYSVDVLSKDSLESVRQEVNEKLGPCNILINGAGGNHPKATTSHDYYPSGSLQDDEKSFFDLDPEAVGNLFDMNFLGTLLPSQVFGQDMLDQEDATVINVSSLNAMRPLTRIPAYSGAKASVSNFTQWLAVYFSKVGIRVNAIAPGFFLTDQNRDLLYEKDGNLSERAEKILSQTPENRFGEPEELVGTLLWLVNKQASGFVNGIVVPVDGGFSAYSGV
ncbi:SDR family oxidoreductase [Alkalibacillus haloalkaliphilus]|uniref:Dioxygenase n=1 Tax=Alkalibacillus haloalkaliphilus TaxID=94136 RepID=A0A511W4V7_9BACI|nr:SDR family oxidoreductase [Alkalibacillus haloalkaliphilus]GEN45987.1 dioxygenase [Alkalibacillus haloalkaliphilus]